jgi:hypothetical protein
MHATGINRVFPVLRMEMRVDQSFPEFRLAFEMNTYAK